MGKKIPTPSCMKIESEMFFLLQKPIKQIEVFSKNQSYMLHNIHRIHLDGLGIGVKKKENW